MVGTTQAIQQRVARLTLRSLLRWRQLFLVDVLRLIRSTGSFFAFRVSGPAQPRQGVLDAPWGKRPRGPAGISHKQHEPWSKLNLQRLVAFQQAWGRPSRNHTVAGCWGPYLIYYKPLAPLSCSQSPQIKPSIGKTRKR